MTPLIRNTMKTQRPIVQYIVLRRDLNWPAGAMAAQAAHASVAAISQALQAQHEPTQSYIGPANLPHMTKYVYGVDDLEGLERIRDQWKTAFPLPSSEASSVQFNQEQESSIELGSFYWWVEQPEDIPTAFATWPIERTNKVSKFVKKLDLSFF